jgi:hypothetical protein
VIASYQCDGTASVGIPDSQIYRCKSVHELVAAGLNRDTCGGDSGGGIYVFGPDNNIFFWSDLARGRSEWEMRPRWHLCVACRVANS